jgi:hypothetical protein
MKRSLLIIIYVFLFVSVKAQKGSVFPNLVAENLENKKITLPKDCKGKFTLIGLAYSQKAQDELQTWFSPVYNTFIAKPEKGLFNESYDINVYLVPMFTGVNEAAAGQAKKKLNAELDKELKPYVLIYKGEIGEYKKALVMNEKDKPYIFLVDEEGKIVYHTSGSYSEQKMDAIEDLIIEEEDDE